MEITYLRVDDLTNGKIWIDFGVSGWGNVTTKLDGIIINRGAFDNQTFAFEYPVSAGSHKVCVEDMCKSLVVGAPIAPPGVNCAKEGEEPIAFINKDCCPGLIPIPEGFWGIRRCRVPPVIPPGDGDVTPPDDDGGVTPPDDGGAGVGNGTGSGLTPEEKKMLEYGIAAAAVLVTAYLILKKEE